MNKIPLLLLSILVSYASHAQTQFWADDFEGANPTSGTRVPSYNGGSGGPPQTRYFKQTTLANINAPGYNGASLQGSQCWAAEDNDGAPNGVSGTQPEEQSVTWTGINISGKSGLSFRGLFATGGVNGWDHGSATTFTDYARVEYNIDNAGWVNLLEFRPTNMNATNGALAVDVNLDGLGDGTTLTTTFAEFTRSIPGSGTTMQLRITVRSNTLAEEFAFDNFRLFVAGSLPVRLIDFSGSHVNGKNQLNWTTASEENSSYFQIERSPDGNSFEKVGTVNAAGASVSIRHYTWQDNYTTAGKLYYRLKQVDLDGSFTHSKVITVQSPAQRAVIRVFPNPVVNRLIVYPGDLQIAQSDIQIYNSFGIQVPLRFIVNGSAYECNTESLSPGVYIVKIVSENGIISKIIEKKQGR